MESTFYGAAGRTRLAGLSSTFQRLFPVRSNPLAARADAHTLAWLDSQDLVDDPQEKARLNATQAGSAVGLLYPLAEQETLELCADLYTWLTAFDDLHVEAAQTTASTLAPHLASFVDVLETRSVPRKPLSPFTLALADIVLRLHDLTTSAQTARVTARLNDIFLAMLWETTLDQRGPSIAEYRAMRPHAVFGHLAAALVAPCARLDSAALDTEPVRRALRSTALVVGWLNDIYSFPYELEQLGSPPRTLPLLLAQERGLSLPEATAEAVRLCVDEAENAHRILEEVAASEQPQLPEYATAIGYAIGGIRLVHQTSDRWRTTPSAP